MKVQIITNLYPVPWDPNRATFNRQQFTMLADHNDVHVNVIVHWTDRVKNPGQCRPSEAHGVSVDYSWYFYVPKIGRRFDPATLYWGLALNRRKIAGFDPDCLLLSWAYPDAVAGIRLARRLGKPAVIKVHGSDINVHGNHPERIGQVIGAMNQAAAIMCVSRDLANSLVKFGIDPAKLHVNYNGVDQQLFSPGDRLEARATLKLEPGRKCILYIGNLKPGKGCLELVEAFAELSATEPDVDLYLAGKGPSRQSIEQLVASRGLQERVTLLGSVDHALLPSWIRASDLVSLPSHNEGVPNVLLEAMSCGTPVVATRVGGIPEVVPDSNGILVNHGDISELTQALRHALQRNWDYAHISNQMQGYSWQNNRKKLQEILELASGAPAPNSGT